jgi:hypothetical protein
MAEEQTHICRLTVASVSVVAPCSRRRIVQAHDSRGPKRDSLMPLKVSQTTETALPRPHQAPCRHCRGLGAAYYLTQEDAYASMRGPTVHHDGLTPPHAASAVRFRASLPSLRTTMMS